jgi:hypothetical protein
MTVLGVAREDGAALAGAHHVARALSAQAILDLASA